MFKLVVIRKCLSLTLLNVMGSTSHVDEYVRVFLYFSLASSKKMSDKGFAQSKYRVFSGKKIPISNCFPRNHAHLRKEKNIYRIIV